MSDDYTHGDNTPDPDMMMLDEIDRLNSHIVALTARTVQLEAAIVSLNEIYPKRIAELEGHLEYHQSETSLRDMVIDEQKTRIAELEAKNKWLRAELDALEVL